MTEKHIATQGSLVGRLRAYAKDKFVKMDSELLADILHAADRIEYLARERDDALSARSATASPYELSGEHPPYFGMPASMVRRYLYRWSNGGMESDYDGDWLCVSNLGYIPSATEATGDRDDKRIALGRVIGQLIVIARAAEWALENACEDQAPDIIGVYRDDHERLAVALAALDQMLPDAAGEVATGPAKAEQFILNFTKEKQ
jgi:hypothetical protein